MEIELARENAATRRFAIGSALFTAFAGIVAFGLAMLAVPIAGANCPSGCIGYPYMSTASRFPNDFLWQPFAILLMLGYLGLMVAIHARAGRSGQVWSLAALCLAVVAAATLSIDYYAQFAVVPASLGAGETEGLPLLIQYNPHGLFIALEELGYFAMSLSLALASVALAGTGRAWAASRWLFRLPLPIVVVATAWFWLAHGVDRQDRLEIVILSVCWLALIANGFVLAFAFRRSGEAVRA